MCPASCAFALLHLVGSAHSAQHCILSGLSLTRGTQTPNINIALFMLFGGLTCTFGLLAAGINHPKANKVCVCSDRLGWAGQGTLHARMLPSRCRTARAT